MNEMTLAELTAQLGGELDGDGSRTIRGVAPLQSAGEDQVTFLTNARYEKYMGASAAGAVIVGKDYSGPRGDRSGLIRCEDPYYAFRQAMIAFYGFREAEFDGIDERAAIDPTAEIGPGVKVAAFATVAPRCRIGEGTIIYPGCYVGPDCSIGSDCILYPNVVLYNATILHERVTIHAGTSIGHDGFGYAPHKDDDGVVRHEKIPQSGWVEIGSDVEIGACCAIDRATMGATIIGSGTKFSNLVAIGHGTKMGKHCLLVAQAGIAGSVMVGNYCVFAGQCGVVGHIRIGDGARIGAQAGVTNDVPAGVEMVNTPAVPGLKGRRVMAGTRKLPEMRDALRKLNSQVQVVWKKLGLSGEREGGDDSPGDEENG